MAVEIALNGNCFWSGSRSIARRRGYSSSRTISRRLTSEVNSIASLARSALRPMPLNQASHWRVPTYGCRGKAFALSPIRFAWTLVRECLAPINR
jgi:hypothetical protein